MSTALDRSVAVVTPSFRRDFELCRLLSESVHLAFPEPVHHYIVVDHNDLALFKPLEDRRTTVLDTYEVLPSRLLRKVPRSRKWIWVGRPRPVPGWVVQQVMKIGFAFHVEEQVLIVSDSDAVFLRPVTTDDLIKRGRVVLAYEPGGIGPHLPLHVEWNDTAHELFGLPRPTYPADDYESNVKVWSSAVAKQLCARIEEVTGDRWDSALVRRRLVAEGHFYGVYAVHLAPEQIEPLRGSVCISEWGHDRVSEEQFVSLLVDGKPHQFAASVSAHSTTTPAERERMIRAHVPLFASR